MTLKRKLECEYGEQDSRCLKQLKLVPFPNASSESEDSDVTMSEAEPLDSPHHVRISSNASTSSSSSDYSSAPSPIVYPSFDIYPLPFFNKEGSVDINSHNFAHYSALPSPNVGLLQPSANFVHHGSRNFVSPAHPDSMESEPCGASANSAAQSRWCPKTTSMLADNYHYSSNRCSFNNF